jgi:hypothetical protein
MSVDDLHPYLLLFFNLHSGGWSQNWVHSAPRPFTGLLYLPRVIVRMDANLSTTNPTWPDPGLNPGRRGGKPATNNFSYGAAHTCYLLSLSKQERRCIAQFNCRRQKNLSTINVCFDKGPRKVTIIMFLEPTTMTS